MIIRNTLIGAFVLGAIAFAAWATDFVTSTGEWTIYTATCEGGAWQDGSCSGQLAASKRYRFRALKIHREVLHWVAGESGESGRYSKCDIQDGRNWKCPMSEVEPVRTITHEMKRGIPVADRQAPVIEYHQVPKWKWELLGLGLPVGRGAMN